MRGEQNTTSVIWLFGYLVIWSFGYLVIWLSGQSNCPCGNKNKLTRVPVLRRDVHRVVPSAVRLVQTRAVPQ
jgi:hypothetical protein